MNPARPGQRQVTYNALASVVSVATIAADVLDDRPANRETVLDLFAPESEGRS